MLQAVSLGLIVGLSGGLWLVVSIALIARNLDPPNSSTILGLLSSFFTLPVFVLGGNWAGLESQLIDAQTLRENASIYLLTTFTLIVTMSGYTMLRLILWLGRTIGDKPKKRRVA